jgi:hypothetical protein
MALEIAGGEIRSVSSIVNPEKLKHIGPVADVSRHLAQRTSRTQSGGRAE